jgi:hypothetical protein
LLHHVSAEPYELNVGRFIQDHRDHVITAGFEGFGFTARRRDAQGRASGPAVTALTLDELAALLEADECGAASQEVPRRRGGT